MPDNLEYVYLSGDPLYVAHVCDLVLLKDLDCDLLSGERMRANLDLAEGAFAKISP